MLCVRMSGSIRLLLSTAAARPLGDKLHCSTGAEIRGSTFIGASAELYLRLHFAETGTYCGLDTRMNRSLEDLLAVALPELSLALDTVEIALDRD